MSIIGNSLQTEINWGMNADVTLTRTSSSGIQLEGVQYSSKRIFVRDTVIDCTTPLTIETNSASHYTISGTTSVSRGPALSAYTDNNYHK